MTIPTISGNPNLCPSSAGIVVVMRYVAKQLRRGSTTVLGDADHWISDRVCFQEDKPNPLDTDAVYGCYFALACTSGQLRVYFGPNSGTHSSLTCTSCHDPISGENYQDLGDHARLNTYFNFQSALTIHSCDPLDAEASGDLSAGSAYPWTIRITE